MMSDPEDSNTARLRYAIIYALPQHRYTGIHRHMRSKEYSRDSVMTIRYAILRK